MTKKVRVRFAPSPTGGLHIGGVRTALFNYLYAKKHGGDFVLRIEDTDQNRYVKGAEQYIEEALEWCGIPYDEGPKKEGGYGPYRQSERKHLYKKFVLTLIEKGKAYYAFDTPESLDAHRKNHEQKGKKFIYNAHNRLKLNNSLSMSEQELTQKISEKTPYVVRFKTPENTQISTKDLIRGNVIFNSNTLDDKILFKSDGMPTYHLANVVDDYLMEITHVIRGEEWLPSLALHQQLYHAFEWESPEFAHLPLIMKPTGKGKLSKRDAEKGGFPIFPLAWKEAQGYREAGYYPEAVVNFLALLGWNPGNEQEIFNLKSLIAAFKLERVQKAGARFNPEKTKWFNQQYLQAATNESLLKGFKKGISALYGADVMAQKKDTSLLKIIGLVKERGVFTKDLIPLVSYFFEAPKTYDEKAVKKQWKAQTSEILKKVYILLSKENYFNSATLETLIKEHIQKQELSFSAVIPPLRLALVGSLSGPHLFDIMEILGKKKCLERITAIQSVLGS